VTSDEKKARGYRDLIVWKTLTGLGLPTGLAAALALSQLISNLLFGVRSTDALTYVAVSAVLFLAAAAACWLSARRATRIDPTLALRQE
jgi:ABC-type antimicrobial peptide transport system permease subunit